MGMNHKELLKIIIAESLLIKDPLPQMLYFSILSCAAKDSLNEKKEIIFDRANIFAELKFYCDLIQCKNPNYLAQEKDTTALFKKVLDELLGVKFSYNSIYCNIIEYCKFESNKENNFKLTLKPTNFFINLIQKTTFDIDSQNSDWAYSIKLIHSLNSFYSRIFCLNLLHKFQECEKNLSPSIFDLSLEQYRQTAHVLNAYENTSNLQKIQIKTMIEDINTNTPFIIKVVAIRKNKNKAMSKIIGFKFNIHYEGKSFN